MKGDNKSKGKRRSAKQPVDAPAGRQAMLPAEKQSVAPTKPGIKTSGQTGERASPEKWEKVRRRAGELALNEGKPAGAAQEKHLRRAKRELLGLQTLTDPDNPLKP